MWENVARRLEGSLVVLEPLEARHKEGLFEAARDPGIWQYLPSSVGGTHNPGESRPAFRSWFEAALEASEEGSEVPFATLDARTGEPIGSTRYLPLRAALPARFEGIFRKHMILSEGRYRDSAYYSIIDDEWPEVRTNLERRLGR